MNFSAQTSARAFSPMSIMGCKNMKIPCFLCVDNVIEPSLPDLISCNNLLSFSLYAPVRSSAFLPPDGTCGTQCIFHVHKLMKHTLQPKAKQLLTFGDTHL